MAEYKVVCSSQAWQDATVLELKGERRLFRSVDTFSSGFWDKLPCLSSRYALISSITFQISLEPVRSRQLKRLLLLERARCRFFR